MAKSSKTKASRAKASGGKNAAPAIPRPTPDNSRLQGDRAQSASSAAPAAWARCSCARWRPTIVVSSSAAGTAAFGRRRPRSRPCRRHRRPRRQCHRRSRRSVHPGRCGARIHQPGGHGPARRAGRQEKEDPHHRHHRASKPPQMAALHRAAKQTAIVLAPNMSVGLNLLLRMVEQVAHALDADWDIEILEMHHRHKVDAPSGTALALGRAAAAGRGADLDHVATRVRDGITGARRRGDIGFAVLRGGDVVSDHRVIFASRRRARRAHAHRHQPRDLRPRRAPRRPVGPGQAARPLLDGRRAGADGLTLGAAARTPRPQPHRGEPAEDQQRGRRTRAATAARPAAIAPHITPNSGTRKLFSEANPAPARTTSRNSSR